MASGSCRQCMQDCTAFVPSVEGDESSPCLCDHPAHFHQTSQNRRVLPSRAGLPARQCFAFRTDGAPVTDFYQECQCGGRYNQHLPLPSVRTTPSSNARNSASINITPAAVLSSDICNRGAPISTRPPAPEPSPSLRSAPLPPMPMYQMPSVTPYNRVTPHCMPSSGIPLPAPPIHILNGGSRNRGNRNRTFASRKPYEITGQARRINKTYKLSVELVMYPYDFIPPPTHVQDGLSVFDESADINISCPD
ncbi:hypothetical protein C8R48DRAFT_780069 [Suillus tomentosus]|nr:hypothetical protein C8R48DRAFT_780069 [Suillus tomentosus]